MATKKNTIKTYRNAIVARSHNRRVVIYDNKNVEGAFQMEIISFNKGFKTKKDVFVKSIFKRKGVMAGVLSIHETTMRMMIKVMSDALYKREVERSIAYIKDNSPES